MPCQAVPYSNIFFSKKKGSLINQSFFIVTGGLSMVGDEGGHFTYRGKKKGGVSGSEIFCWTWGGLAVGFM